VFQAILWVFVGAILGGLASILLRLNSQRRELLDILAGSVGALSAGALWSFGLAFTQRPNTADISFLVSGLGAAIALVVVNAICRRWQV
jgi:uncharacterized membrane protein YeaQ/YmgE (transglycosylase-associated protein family)